MAVFIEEISSKAAASSGSWNYAPRTNSVPGGGGGSGGSATSGGPGYSASTGTSRGKRLATGGDSSSRNRALLKRLNELERENYRDGVKVEVPKPSLLVNLRVGLTTNSRRVLGSRKTLNNHLDDDVPSTQAFLDAAAKPSRYPSRKTCEICGYWGYLTCLQCEAKYCSSVCGATHKEARCMKSYS